MKKQILICVFTIFIFTKVLSAQCIGGLTQVSVISFGNGVTVSFTDPISNLPYSGYAGTVNSTMDNNALPVYCVDLHRNVNLPDNSYTDTCSYVEPKMQYILNHYFPYVDGYPGKLSDNNLEAASIQTALWHYSDNVDANTITDNTIKTRALEILNDANINGNATQPIITFTIEASVNPDAFYVKTVDDDGNGIEIHNIQLSISAGTLNPTTVNTNASGISPDVIVTGSGIITATANMLYSQGRKLHSTSLVNQSLTIAYPVFGMMEITYDWGALPVELSSFVATSNGSDITLAWTTVSELNNSHFDIERKSVTANEWKNAGSVQGSGTSSTQHTYSFKDRNLSSGTYSYRLKQIDINGNYEYFNLSSNVEVGTPSKFDLSQNYPNPFNPSTKINFEMATEGNVSIAIFDNLGRQVSTLVNEFKSAGYYTLDFNASNLPSGLYYYKMNTAGFSKVMKMTLVK